MRRYLLGLFCAAFCATSNLAGQSLPKRLDRLLDAPPFDRHFWGVAVLDSGGKLLYQRNATHLFIPASNTKLIVAAAATALLPPEGTVVTSLYAAGPIEAGLIRGDLVLYGRGDPTMSRRCFDPDTTRAGACEADPMRRLRDLAAQLHARGIRTIAGNVVGDGSYFEPALIHDTWEQADLNWWYAAPVSGLAFNDNSLDVHWGPGPMVGAPGVISLSPDLGDVTVENRTTTVDSAGSGLDVGWLTPLSLWSGGTIGRGASTRTSYVALADPNRLAASALRRALAEAGIAVQGATQSTTDSMRYAGARATPPVAESSSRPFREWLVPILGPSQNLFAEMLVKQVGRLVGGEGSWRAGLAVERRLLIDSVGIDSTQFSLRDGSGLSHVNVVSPLAFARLLLWLRARPNFAGFERALPVAGRSGTVRNRMLGTAVEGRVRAKTGSISRVNAFSGYVTLPNGRVRIFSIQTNNHDLGGDAMIARIDSLVVEIGEAVTPKDRYSLRAMTEQDWPEVRRIYAEGLATGRASFETEVPDWLAWNAGHFTHSRLVAEHEGEVAGWAALMPVSARACFRGVAEVSVYVGEAARGAGAGRALLEALIPASEAAGIWTLWSSIHTDNRASVVLHERCGFRMIGRRERIAMRGGIWADTWNMERRSAVVGR